MGVRPRGRRMVLPRRDHALSNIILSPEFHHICDTIEEAQGFQFACTAQVLTVPVP
jgi:hypothetical protein